MKTCSTCGETKPHAKFYRDQRYRDGYRGQCRDCIYIKCSVYSSNEEVRAKRREQSRIRVAANPRTPEQDWAFRLRANYGLTVERFNEMLDAQGGGCAICRKTDPGSKGRFHIDHDHSCCPGKKSCGKCVRALLCPTCNVGIGMLGDSPDLLRRAAEYVENFPALLQALGSTV